MLPSNSFHRNDWSYLLVELKRLTCQPAGNPKPQFFRLLRAHLRSQSRPRV